MMSKHTQGEWGFRGAEGCIGTDLQLVACVYPMEAQNAEELAANMRLIAAAPDLLEACRMLLSLIRRNAPELSGKVCGYADAAIAKATGDE
jgi:hypothetical protein